MSQSGEFPAYPSFRSFFWSSLLLSLFGWGGLAVLVATTLPTLGPRWLFFFLLLTGVSGTALPVAYFINLRFRTQPPASSNAVLREAMLFGIYACLVAWLLQGHVLTAPLAIILALGFFLVEFLIRVREVSQWKPKDAVDE